jgi:hypothetical protein
VDEVCVSGPMLKRKSGHNDYRGTGGCFSPWKCWFWIILKKAHDRKESTHPVSADQWKFTKLPNLLMKSCADVYNVDRTSLFYCARLDASLS